jgi:hypothetical protein
MRIIYTTERLQCAILNRGASSPLRILCSSGSVHPVSQPQTLLLMMRKQLQHQQKVPIGRCALLCWYRDDSSLSCWSLSLSLWPVPACLRFYRNPAHDQCGLPKSRHRTPTCCFRAISISRCFGPRKRQRQRQRKRRSIWPYIMPYEHKPYKHVYIYHIY